MTNISQKIEKTKIIKNHSFMIQKYQQTRSLNRQNVLKNICYFYTRYDIIEYISLNETSDSIILNNFLLQLA